MVSTLIGCRTIDKKNLCIREWRVPGITKGVVCAVHGLGEHSGRYAHVAARLTEQGYTVFMVDMRGHGRSDGKRGHAPSLETLLDDISLLLEHASISCKGLPCFLYGHSMGGGLVINHALRRRPPVAGAIITSPWLRLETELSRVSIFTACIANILTPSLTRYNRLDSRGLSHDSKVEMAYMEDPLVHHRVSVRLFNIMHSSGIWAIEHAESLTIPMLLMHGSRDPYTSHEASRQFAVGAGMLCEFASWDGLYHELHNELERADVINRMVDWIKSKTP